MSTTTILEHGEIENIFNNAKQGAAALQASLRQIEARREAHQSSPNDQVQVEIPAALLPLFEAILREISAGKAIGITALDSTITTQQAADLLGISRSTVIRLIEDGTLPCNVSRSHRRLNLKEVLDFKKQRRIKAREALRKASQISAEFDLADFEE